MGLAYFHIKGLCPREDLTGAARPPPPVAAVVAAAGLARQQSRGCGGAEPGSGAASEWAVPPPALPAAQPAPHTPAGVRPGWEVTPAGPRLADPTPHASAFVPTSGVSLHSCLPASLLCKEPVGIFGFKKEKLFLSSSPSVISFLLVVPILHLARQPGV